MIHKKSKNLNSQMVTGAEAVAILIQKAGIKFVFAYPGTSELALCNAVLNTNGMQLINGRGDKESAFMASGGSAIFPIRAAAILHGARGLTNASGAIADAYRNEISTIYLVGLPTISSQPFLPPHGEKKLIKSIGNFVKFSTEITEFASELDSEKEKQKKVDNFVKKITEAIDKTRTLPLGPSIIGLPQDAMEQRWIPKRRIEAINFAPIREETRESQIKIAANLLQKKNKIVILIDDFIFKTEKAKEALRILAQSLQAPVLQIRYLRGPMLFERLNANQNPYFAGSYDLGNKSHKELLINADLLITIEDRNGYPRVIGKMPNCSKIAISSNSDMTRKNGYLKKGDIMIEGNVAKIISLLAESTKAKRADNNDLIEYCKKLRERSSPKIISGKEFDFMRRRIPEIIANALYKIESPIIVDDSQMFGGLLFENYDKFPMNLRIIGDHGAFIGGGMATAAGLSLSMGKNARVICTLGDQSFTNGLQSLVAVSQENAPVIYLVCNNGKTVSLTKQILSQDGNAFDSGQNRFLENSPKLHYAEVAKEFGILSYKIDFNSTNKSNNIQKQLDIFESSLNDAIARWEPALIELIVPSNPLAWKGIWSVSGNER